MKRGLALALALRAGAAWGADEGLGKGGASYLHFSLGARAIGMGHAQTAVLTDDASAIHANSALLSLQRSHALTFTTASLGVDRSLYYAGYVLPFHSRREEEDLFSTEGLLSPSEQRANARPDDSEPEMPFLDFNESSTNTPSEGEATRVSRRRTWQNALVGVSRTDMAVGLSMTHVGITGIEGRSEFGAREADFQDAERAISLAYSARPYDNLSIGIGGKYLGQTLQSASAKGFGFDVGVWYGVPYLSLGHLSLALTARDLGANLKWKVPDAVLDTEYSYEEKVLGKWIFGAAYTSPAERWLFAVDFWKVSQQKLKIYTGAEYRLVPSFHFRAGASAYNPTGGFGWVLRRERLELQLDYAYEYDLNNLSSPHWLTLTMRFLPRH